MSCATVAQGKAKVCNNTAIVMWYIAINACRSPVTLTVN